MIFTVTKKTCDEAGDLISNADKAADRAYQMLVIFSAIIDGIPRVLRDLRNGITSLSNLNDNLIRGLRNNPAIRGPWKIVALAFAGMLAGLGFVLDGLKTLVVTLLNAMRGPILRKLQDVIKFLRRKLLDYNLVSEKSSRIVTFLGQVSAWLEPNEGEIDPGDLVLYPMVDNTHLADARAYMTALNDILTDINRQIDDIEKKVDEVNTFLNSVNPVIALSAAVSNALNSVLGVFNDIFQKIKDLISGIPGIGWLLDKLDSLIDWAMEKLGIKDMLRRMGEALGNLPFFSAVKSFLKDVESYANLLIAQVEQLMAQVDDKMKELEKVKAEAVQILVKFLSNLPPKLVQELILPEDIQQLLDESREFEDVAKGEMRETAGDDLAARYEKIRSSIRTVIDINAVVPHLPFNREHQSALDRTMNQLFLEQPARVTSIHDMRSEVARIIPVLEELKSIYEKAIPRRFGPEYRQQGAALWAEAQTDPVIIEALHGQTGPYAEMGLESHTRITQPATKGIFKLSDRELGMIDDAFPVL